VSFDAAGSLASVEFLPMTDTAACEQAAQVLLLVSARPTDLPARPGEKHVILLPFFQDFAACDEPHGALPPRASGEPVGGEIREPRKTKTVTPHYPRAAIDTRRSGVVTVEALISPTGCVHSAEVVTGRHLDLASEALRAVMQWRYTPTLLRGEPVPVLMTVTVNFRLD
jgi:TonB family protein